MSKAPAQTMPPAVRQPGESKENRKAFPNISRTLDCNSEGKSTKHCAEIVESKGDEVITLLEAAGGPNWDIGCQVTDDHVIPATGRDFAWLPHIGPKYPDFPTDHAAVDRFYQHVSSFRRD
ncbi:hypothetical protein ONS96_011812 [Cadophora gregata f. sp. sojae]|nr:hypothetical protein ONS96_011812 [Cadophora gregata f. sp. sojae]